MLFKNVNKQLSFFKNFKKQGLERQGRELAKKYGTQMIEYWPFLDEYCDITSAEGLQMLENHLLDRSKQECKKTDDPNNTTLGDIASVLERLNLNDDSSASSEDINLNQNVNQQLGLIEVLDDKEHIPNLDQVNANHSGTWSMSSLHKCKQTAGIGQNVNK